MPYRRISIQYKIIAFILGAFLFFAFTVTFITTQKLYHILNENQAVEYGNQVQLILTRLAAEHDRLRHATQDSKLEQDSKDAILKKLYADYYSSVQNKVFPYIVDYEGKVVLHPILERGSRGLQSTDFLPKIIDRKQGQLNYICTAGNQKWTIFKEFKPWGWIVGFSVPISVKYRAAKEMNRTLLFAIFGTSLFVLVVLFFFLRQMISPILELARSSQEIAQGNFDRSVMLRRQDEIGLLAKNFEMMRAAIKKQLTELEQHRTHLEDLVDSRTAELRKVNEDLEQSNMDLKIAQKQLLQSDKMAALGQLSAGVAHEIKNPLAIILLSMESMEEHIDQLDDLSRQFLEMAKNAADRANKVVVELLNFSRLTDIRLDKVGVWHVLNTTLVLVENHARIKDSVVSAQCLCDRSVVIKGNRILLQQVFFNLLVNAIDASPKDGKVSVKMYLEKGEGSDAKKVVIMIADYGCGIPEENIGKIFDPFYTTKERGRGTGLGLSTVYSIVKRHGGTIEVQSEVDKGTVFFIRFPIL